MKKKIVAVLLAACLTLAPSLSSADELMDITRAAGYTEATEAYRPQINLLIDGNTGDVLWEEKLLMRCVTLFLCLRPWHFIWSLKLCLKGRDFRRYCYHSYSNRPSYCRYLRNFQQQDCCGCWLYRFRTHHYDLAVPSSNVTTVMLLPTTWPIMILING